MDDVLFTVVDTKGGVSLQTSMRVIKPRGHDGLIASCPQSLIKSLGFMGRASIRLMANLIQGGVGMRLSPETGVGKPVQEKAEAMHNVSLARRRRRAAFQHGVSRRAQPSALLAYLNS